MNKLIASLDPSQWEGRYAKDFGAGCDILRVSDQPGYHLNYAVTFEFRDDKLMMISSSAPDLPTLGRVVQHLGPPESIKALSVSGPSGTGYGIEVYYPSQGIALQVHTEANDLGHILPQMRVSEVNYYVQGELLSYFTERFGCGGTQAAALDNARHELDAFVRPWPGFGPVTPVVIPGP